MDVQRALRNLRELLQTFGVSGINQRVVYELKRRSGLLRKQTPQQGWNDIPDYGGAIGNSPVEPVNIRSYQELVDSIGISMELLVSQADAVLSGELLYFSSQSINTGFPPDWHYQPETEQRFPAEVHWTHIPDLSPELGDIKYVWEPSRFSFAFVLIRAYAATGDEKYAEGFWSAFEDWCLHNPPNAGPNWRCGQESSLRLISWVIAWSALRHAPSSTPARVGLLKKAMIATGYRVEANIGYALSQRNNHGISEALGLWTVALMLPEYPSSRRWAKIGRQLLIQLAADQFAHDGGYIQQSVNYQRLALQLYLWAMRLAEVNGEQLPKSTMDRIYGGAELLYRLQDTYTGQLPNYGANDGANLLPLTDAIYEDYRPTLQAVYFLADRTKRYALGAHDELGWWMFGESFRSAAHRAAPAMPLRAESSGYYVLRGQRSHAFIRAAKYTSRPSQADNFHIDIWHRGQNIVFDPGSYSYNASAPWNNSLAKSMVHNVVTMDGYDQMTQRSKFLWLDWIKSTQLSQQAGPNWEYLEFKHSAYQHLDPSALHRRGILRVGETYVCIDQVNSDKAHDWRLHWNLQAPVIRWNAVESAAQLMLPSDSYLVQVFNRDASTALHEATDASPLGWESTRYGEKRKGSFLASTVHAKSAQWLTVFGHRKASITDGKLVLVPRDERQSPGSHLQFALTPTQDRLLDLRELVLA